MPYDPVFCLQTRMKDFGITPQHIENATNILEKSNGWIGYIKAIKTKARANDLRAEDEEWPGEFLMPLILQQQISTV
jgi:hypothetical protein